MSDGEIPINLGDLPIDSTPMDDSLVYTGELHKATLSPKTDKNGNVFAQLQIVVTEGDFEGRTVVMNYLPLPTPITAEMTKRARIIASDRAVAFARFCRSFGITGTMPSVSLTRPESVSAWNDWISRAYGRQGKFTVKNQEYPEGSGRMRSGIADFVI